MQSAELGACKLATSTLSTVRAAIWHFRKGGVAQVGTWWGRRHSAAGPAYTSVARRSRWGRLGKKRLLSFSSVVVPKTAPRRQDVRAAVILDNFSALCFDYEWDSVYVTPNNWHEQLADCSIDLLFVESAWAGNSGAWKYQITGEGGPGKPLTDLVAWCRGQGIPTVFWSKEDPPHYDDFLPAAKLFDFVFTSDVAKVDDYRRDLGHENVGVLSFAAQPSIHNPIRPKYGWHARDVAFAGMYFAHKYPERAEQMDLLLGGAIEASRSMSNGLEIFSRQLGGNPSYQFPDPFSKHVVASLPYEQMLSAYKAYKVFLNVNSVTSSPSMCARRIFEITASGTPVVTTRSKAVEEFFPNGEVKIVDSKPQASEVIKGLVRSPELGDRLVHRGQRNIWSNHTYAHRVSEVLSAAVPKKATPRTASSVSVLISTFRPHQLEHVFRTVSSQGASNVELVLLTHGFTPDQRELGKIREANPVDAVTLLAAPRHRSLGECLNDCVDAASGNVLTKMDDDDYYSPNYLTDQLHTLNYSSADLIGKQAHYMYLESLDATILRFADREHRFTHTVMGPTIMARREVFVEHRFGALPKGEDTDFLNRVMKSCSIYSSDRFGYYQYRGGAGHTWTVSDDELLSSGNLVFFGNPTTHVNI